MLVNSHERRISVQIGILISKSGSNIAVTVMAPSSACASVSLARCNMGSQRPVSSSMTTISQCVGSTSGRNGLRNGTHPFSLSSMAFTSAQPSATTGIANVKNKSRSSSVHAKTTPSDTPVSTASGTSSASQALFTGAGVQGMGVSALVGGFVLLSFLWFLSY